jgi:hypothetical protein
MDIDHREGDSLRLRKHRRLIVLLVAVFLIPVATYSVLPWIPPMGHLPGIDYHGFQFPPTSIQFEQVTVGPEPRYHPTITNVQIIDFDQDGRSDVVACDAQSSSVILYTQGKDGDWRERVLGRDLAAPAHATVVDIEQDGDLDVIVSVLGNLYPDDSVIGSIVLLENQGDNFVPRVLLDDVRRVADAQAADFDGDGDLDLAVAVFGYARGQVLWLENLGALKFREHELLSAPGSIHVPLADYDGDGDVDIAAVVSQNEEEVWGFENLGKGAFNTRRLFFTVNYDIGSGGLVRTDLDDDGDPDLLLPVGDNLEEMYSYPQPYHGCLWLENKGDWDFAAKRIATFGGTYAADAGDLDNDGDKDVVLVSMFNEWQDRDNASVIWLENDGQQNFTPWQISNHPTHLITAACGDLNGDGRDDIVAGGLHIPPPYDRIGRITAWISAGDK